LSKKGITVWLFSSLTFIALIHLIEATSSLIFNNQIRFLQLYPFIGEKLQTITPLTYFIASATATLVLWGITCAAAFTNPVETFLNRILSDAKKQSSVETQMLEEKSEILDVMNETIESSKEVLAQVRDMIYNVRTEVKEIQPLKEGIEKMKSEIGSLRKEVKRLEEKVYFPKVCLNCGKPILPEFKICPYCGENVKFLPENMISVKEYK
jgi:RNA polymerase-binding transcription factor DksA